MPEPAIQVPTGKVLRVEVTPLDTPTPLAGRMCGLCGAEATPIETSDLYNKFLRAYGGTDPAALSQEQLAGIELQLREAALAEEDPELRERLWEEYRKYKGM